MQRSSNRQSGLAREMERLVASVPLVPLSGGTGGGYRAVGAGPSLLVVLPGIAGPGDALAALAPALGDRWRVCFVTYPRVDTLADLLTWLEALRHREGREQASLYGGSFGGLVAQAWLAHAPEAIGDIVLAGTGPPDPARAARNTRALRWMGRLPMPAWRVLLHAAVWGSTRRAVDRATWRAYFGRAVGELTWPDVESRYRVSIDLDAAGPPASGVLARWGGRMLVLEGSRDPVARTHVREALRATYPAARFHVFEGAGHGMALEQPERWLEVVSAFYRGA